jgi:type II secretory pathway pseudopilin PulG
MRDPAARPRQEGFTLIEVMVAVLLTVIAVIGSIGLYRIETNASAYSRRQTEAAILAEDRLETLRTLAPPAGTMTLPEEASLDAFGVVVPGGIYTRTTAFIQDAFDATQFEVVVTVSWLDDAGDSRSVIVRGRRSGT